MADTCEQREARLKDHPNGINGYKHLPKEKPLPSGKVTYEEFLEWIDEDTHAEWIDGEIIMTSPASYRHQDLKGFLESLMRLYAERFDLGVVVSAGYQMKLPDSGREPDLLFVAKNHKNRVQRTFLDGPADLAIEIISPESVERDRITKFEEYSAGEVPEYWLIDPDQQQAEFYQLDQNRQYRRVIPDSEGKYYSKSVKDFWLKLDWLWQVPLPKVEDVLFEVGGEAYVRQQLEKLKQRGFQI